MAQDNNEAGADSLVDNQLRFMVESERIRARGMMKVCISDTSGRCIDNLQSGFVIKVYDATGEVLWTGKTAGRENMLKFPQRFQEAAWITLEAFKPFVLNTYTGSRIYQDKPLFLKYNLEE